MNVVLIVLGLLALVGLALRPRLLLAPVTVVFALVTWAKLVARILFQISELLAAWILEKNAATLAHHATVASSLWTANTVYRDQAREIFQRVVKGYGIMPASEEMHPAVAVAASAVQSTLGKKKTDGKPIVLEDSKA